MEIESLILKIECAHFQQLLNRSSLLSKSIPLLLPLLISLFLALFCYFLILSLTYVRSEAPSSPVERKQWDSSVHLLVGSCKVNHVGQILWLILLHRQASSDQRRAAAQRISCPRWDLGAHTVDRFTDKLQAEVRGGHREFAQDLKLGS